MSGSIGSLDAAAAEFWFVMPVHRRGTGADGYLVSSLASLAAQTDRCWRLVVVLDASPDLVGDLQAAVADAVASAGIADRSTVIVQLEQGGPGAARNAGIAAAREAGAQFVAFLDSDDVCRPDRLAVTRAAFVDDDTVDMFFSSFELIDEHGDVRGQTDLPGSIAEILARQAALPPVLHRPWLRMACSDGYLSLTSTVALRAEVAAAVPFPATFVSEDWHTWLRAFAIARSVAFSPEPLTEYRVPTEVASGSRSEHGYFSWLKALVDSDAVARVLIGEVARGELSEQAALHALAEHRRMSAITARSDFATVLADALDALGQA
ncbi:MAG: glycosyltransferase [Candidatus Nanopelagicales bacterium]